MKSEERHKLETNYLADHVGMTINSIRPYIKWIFIGLGVLFLLGLIYAWYQSANTQRNSKAWEEMLFADGDADQLTTIYEDHAKTAAAPWAKLRQADSQLSRAIEQVYLDRDQALELIKQAKRHYQSLIDESFDINLRFRAMLAMAKALETEGDREGAIENYRKVLSANVGNEALVEEVRRQVAWLEGPEGREFMTWFASQRPKRPDPLDIPSNLRDTSPSPDIQFPELKANDIPPSEPIQFPIEAPPMNEQPVDTGSNDSTSAELPTSDSSKDAKDGEQ